MANEVMHHLVYCGIMLSLTLLPFHASKLSLLHAFFFMIVDARQVLYSPNYLSLIPFHALLSYINWLLASWSNAYPLYHLSVFVFISFTQIFVWFFSSYWSLCISLFLKMSLPLYSITFFSRLLFTGLNNVGLLLVIYLSYFLIFLSCW